MVTHYNRILASSASPLTISGTKRCSKFKINYPIEKTRGAASEECPGADKKERGENVPLRLYKKKVLDDVLIQRK